MREIKCSECSKVVNVGYRYNSEDEWRCADCYILAIARYYPQKLESGKIYQLDVDDLGYKIKKLIK